MSAAAPMMMHPPPAANDDDPRGAQLDALRALYLRRLVDLRGLALRMGLATLAVVGVAGAVGVVALWRAYRVDEPSKSIMFTCATLNALTVLLALRNAWDDWQGYRVMRAALHCMLREIEDCRAALAAKGKP